MSMLGTLDKVHLCLPYLQKSGFIPETPSQEELTRLEKIIIAAGERIKVAGDILDYKYLYQKDNEIIYDEKSLDKCLHKSEAASLILSEYKNKLAQIVSFDATTIEIHIKKFAEIKNVKLALIIHAIRVSITGTSIGFGLFDTMELLGKESCIRRIDHALALK